MIQKVFKTIVLVVALSAVAACGQSKTTTTSASPEGSPAAEGEETIGTLEQIKEEGTLTVGVMADYAPFSSVGDDEKQEGLEIDIARYLALELIGEEALIEFVPLKFEERIEKLESGEVDILIAALSQTEERQQQIDYSELYYSSGLGAIVPEDSPFESWADLKGKKICSEPGVFYNAELETMGIEVVEVETSADIIPALKEEKCDAAGLEDVTISTVLRQPGNDDLKDSKFPPLFPTPWGMGIRRGEDNETFKQAVNTAILKMEAEGLIVEGEKKWQIGATDYAQERMELAKEAVAAAAQAQAEAEQEEESYLSGYLVVADGASAVYPVARTLAESFEENNKGVRVGVGNSGIGQGFEEFCSGTIDVVNAARPINQEEMKMCRRGGTDVSFFQLPWERKRVRYVELPFAFDGIVVAVNNKNDWASCLKPEELEKIWQAEAANEIVSWDRVREGFPDTPLVLSAPLAESATSEYFLESIVGPTAEIRADYDAKEDETLIPQAIAAEEGGLGFMGLSTYEENKDTLKLVAIENVNGECVEPTRENIANDTYKPLSRPLFFYVREKGIEENPAVKDFSRHLLNPENQDAIARLGYVPLPENLMDKVQTRLKNLVTGTLFGGGSTVGLNLENILSGARTTKTPEELAEDNEG